MFKDLKEAIEAVLNDPSESNLRTLRYQHALHFIEPEDDTEFQEWKKKGWENVCFPDS